jgi:hypothetical protein
VRAAGGCARLQPLCRRVRQKMLLLGLQRYIYIGSNFRDYFMQATCKRDTILLSMQLYAISLQFTTNFRFLDVVSGFMSKQQCNIEVILVNR